MTAEDRLIRAFGIVVGSVIVALTSHAFALPVCVRPGVVAGLALGYGLELRDAVQEVCRRQKPNPTPEL